MANSVQYAKTQDTPSVKLDTNELHGRVRIAYADYTAAGAQETINMFKLPNGARIIEGRVNHAQLAASNTTLSIGHAAYVNAAGTTVAADVDEYKAAAAATSVSAFNIANTTALGENSVVDAPDGLIVTATTAGANATGFLSVAIRYVLD